MFRLFRLSISSAAFLSIFLWPGCVSRSLPEQRFAESVGLAMTVVSPTVSDAANFSFSVVGDVHIKGTESKYLENMLALSGADGDAFAVMLGDIADTGTAEQVDTYHRVIAASPLAGKVFSVIGNHDIFDDGWNQYKTKTGPNHYTFTVGNSKFIVADTADATLGKAQTGWLMQELNNRSTTNVFLLTHYPPIVPDWRSYLRFSDTEEAQGLMKASSDHQVTGWFAGHYHSYVQQRIGNVEYLVAGGGGGGRRMTPVLESFYVKVTVAGASVRFDLKKM